MIALDYLLLQQPQWDTAAMLVLYAALIRLLKNQMARRAAA